MIDENLSEFPINVMVEMAQNLTTPGNGDVEFICQDRDCQVKSLYALRPILTARCAYYAKSSSLIDDTNQTPVFAFDKNSHSHDECSNDKSHGLGPYQKKETDDDFDLLHTILYYLYTDHITFGIEVDTVPSLHLPKICEVEDIYMAADRMFLEELKQKALHFLKLSCTPCNITPRVMSKFAELHEEIASIYAEYFRKNWDRIKGMNEFNQFFKKLNNEDLDEILRVYTKFQELMKDAVFLDSR